MMVFAGAAILAMAQAPIVHSEVAFDELVRGQDAAAIERINANEVLDADDPARLINLGVAHARRGDTEQARAMFQAALQSPDRAELETANGEWVDSRWLARKALAMLNEGQLDRSERMAAR